MTDNQKIKEAIRMIGYLLETNSTDEWVANDKYGREVDYDSPKACTWCLVGAIAITTKKLNLDKYSLDKPVASVLGIRKADNFWPLASVWDSSSEADRKVMVSKLKEIQ